MNRWLNTLFAAALLFSAGCTLPTEQPPPRKKSVEMDHKESPEPADDSRKNEIERIAEEARDAANREEWSDARQIIANGLKLAENQQGLERQRARLVLLLGNIERDTGNEMEARRQYMDAMAMFHVRKDDQGRFETLLAKSQLEAMIGDYAAATREITEAESYLPKLKDRGLIGRFKMAKGRLASRQVKYQDSYDTLVEAIQIFEAIKDNQSRAEALLLLAAVEDKLGQTKASKRSLEKALALFTEKEDPDGRVRALHRLATYAERERQYKKARKMLTEVLELYEQLDQKTAAANLRRHLNALPAQESDTKKKK